MPKPKRVRSKGPRISEEDKRRMAEYEQERKQMVQNSINQMNADTLKGLLLKVKDREPGLIFDILENGSNKESPISTQFPSAPPWCKCRNCVPMPTELEEKCCGCLPRNCISKVPDLDVLVLDQRVLTLANCYRKDIFGLHKQKVLEFNKVMRHTAYRQFVLWRHGRLSSGVRRVIPSCVVKRIRETFPSLNNVYTGFLASRLA